MNCKVFISYRRSVGTEAANWVYKALHAAGFDAFMDVRDLSAGHYPPALLAAIEQRDAFVLILTPQSLDRCHETGDWFMREITKAIELKKVIIPFLTQGFDWPETLPLEMASLPTLQSVPSSPEFPEARIDKLKEYLEAVQLPGPPAPEGLLVVGSGNIENLVKLKPGNRLVMGDKHAVTFKNSWGGSGVNITCRLLAEGIPVIPVLAIGQDEGGHAIRDAIRATASSGNVLKEVEAFLQNEVLLMKAVHTANSTILIHEGERTIFGQQMKIEGNFNEDFKNRLNATLQTHCKRLRTIVLGHMRMEGKDSHGPGPGGCTLAVLENAPDNALIYADFGRTQLDLGWRFWKDHLQRVDVFQCNMKEVIGFLSKIGKRTSHDILRFFREQNRTVVLTMDRFGAVAVLRNSPLIHFVWPLIGNEEMKDATGAGDAFAAGMVSRLHNDPEGRRFSASSFEQALHEGAIWAAAACKSDGGCGEDPKKDLAVFRDEHPECSTMRVEKRDFESAQDVLRFIDLAYH
jgi:sugar/nucleoside kinase (ribokinase family)